MRTIAISGSASGIGAATRAMLEAAGDTVIGIDLRDAEVTAWLDLREVQAGDACPMCEGPLRVDKTIEVGHIFKLGTRYSEALSASVLDEKSASCPIRP